MHAVDTLGVVGLFQKAGLHLTRHSVDAADRRQDPQFVAHADLAVGATVDLYVAIGGLNKLCLKIRVVAIRVQVAQIRARVVSMNMLTRRHVHQRMTDWQTVFNDVFALRNIA